MRSARAVWFERPGIAVVRTEPLREPEAGEVVVRTLVTGISAGTEAIVLGGHVPREAREAMALATMKGHFEFPVSYGYAAVGVVETAHGKAEHASGARCFAFHPHHDRFVLSASALRALPDGPPLERLVLAPNLETAVNVCWDADVALGERLVVAGLGVVGLLVVWLARRSGAASVVGVDPDPERRALATALGATDVTAAVDTAPVGEADACIDVSGAPSALEQMVRRAGVDARVVVASWYGDRPCTLPLGGTFHPNRVTLRSSQVASIAGARRGRWSTARRWALVTELLGSGELDRLVAPPVPLSDAPRVYAELAAGARWNPPQRVFDATR